MNIKIHDTLRDELVPFIPIKRDTVRIYVCGPTVYDFTHIGHARTYIAFDVIVRYLTYRGYEVKYIVNITDIDDKIIRRAKESKVSPMDLARKFEKMFLEDMKSLNVRAANLYPRVSDHIPEIIRTIQVLLEKGYAYQVNGDVYFDVTRSRDLGKLSHQSLSELWAGARIEVDERKRNSGDFVLWKSSKEGEPYWMSPFGKGRPGWHIECSAMSLKYFGEQFDVHGGALELVFPHHENEIAQSEAYTGKKPVVKYWVHTGLLFIRGEKMSKSLGNFITITDLLKKYDVNTFRLFITSTHYRNPIDYSERSMEQASQSLKRIYDTIDHLRYGIQTGKEVECNEDRQVREEMQVIKTCFLTAMNNDFNTPDAYAEFFTLIRLVNRAVTFGVCVTTLKNLYSLIMTLGCIFGLNLKRAYEISDEDRELVEERNLARKNKDWSRADQIRDELQRKGIILKDYSTGTLWTIER